MTTRSPVSMPLGGVDPALERARTVPPKTVYYLFSRAGGRCEFRGCNAYLLEHHVTGDLGNYGEKGHIYAFKQGGSRGVEADRPDDIHDIANLILLCHGCHKLVDVERPAEYPVALLRRFKQEHEDRIFSLTSLSENRKTVPIVFKGLVAGRDMQISNKEIADAVFPNYPVLRDQLLINLSPIPDTPDESFWTIGQRKLHVELNRLHNLAAEYGSELKLSVFGLAPIPLLMYLGSQLSDKVAINLFQRHREPESWQWKEGPGAARYQTQRLSNGAGEVALLLNLSSANPVEMVFDTIGQDASVYALTLADAQPSPRFLNTLEDLTRLRSEYERLLACVRAEYPRRNRVHIFPAVPAPVAIMCGQVRLPKVDADFSIYDRDKRSGGFTFCLELT
ncbi:MAG: SAVED domain-containing protein [Pseudomonadales bacterium]